METVLLIPKTQDGTAADKSIPPVSPSLMPFHIAYSGPAPISTYFMPRKFVDEQEQLRKGLIENNNNVAGVGASTSTTSKGEKGVVVVEVESKYFRENGKDGEAVVAPTAPVTAEGTVDGKQGEEEEERLSAAFRGRRVISQNVRIPEGFVGVLLTEPAAAGPASSSSNVHISAVDDEGNRKRPESPRKAKAAAAAKAKERAKALKAKAAAKLKAKGKATRKSKRNAREDGEEEVDELEDDEEDEEEDERDGDDDENNGEENGERTGADSYLRGDKNIETGVGSGGNVVQKAFQVKGVFDTFKLWHPDVPVSEGQDEYIRSLKEWISLNAEIHKI